MLTEKAKQKLYKEYPNLTFNDLSDSIFWETLKAIGCKKEFNKYLCEQRRKETLVGEKAL